MKPDHHILCKNDSTALMIINGNTADALLDNGNIEKTEGKVLIRGPKGEALFREDTVVGGCDGCAGGRLVKGAKIKCTPASCWDRRSINTVRCIVVTLSLICILSFMSSFFLLFTNFFNNTLLQNMVLTNSSLVYEMWANPPVQPTMKVHIYNYTNADKVMTGKEKKLKVEEVGPYVYRETLTRVNTVFHENGTITFQNRRSYKYISDETAGHQFDKIMVPNLPFFGAISVAKDSYYVAQIGMSTLFKSLNTKPFLELPVHRFLWGYEDNLVTLAKPILQLQDMNFEHFGLLVTRNGTIPERVTMNTGLKDMEKFGIIESINGVSFLRHWGTKECNRMDGTDGTVFPPPSVERKEKMYVYNTELCRRVPLYFTKEVESVHGIKALRYEMSPNLFDTPETNQDNQCFCNIDTGKCLPKGVFNTGPCAFGVPIIASFPHFYNGDESLTNAIDGIGKTEVFENYVDLHPNLGIPMRAKSSLQINIQVRKGSGISGIDYLQDDLILPIAYIEMSVQELPQSVKTLIYHGTYSANAVRLTLIWVSVLVFFISGLILLMSKKRISFRCHHKTSETPYHNH